MSVENDILNALINTIYYKLLGTPEASYIPNILSAVTYNDLYQTLTNAGFDNNEIIELQRHPYIPPAYTTIGRQALSSTLGLTAYGYTILDITDGYQQYFWNGVSWDEYTSYSTLSSTLSSLSADILNIAIAGLSGLSATIVNYVTSSLSSISGDVLDITISLISAASADLTSFALYAASSAVSAHVADINPHPQYATLSIISSITSSNETFALNAASSAVSAHVADINPHPQYQQFGSIYTINTNTTLSAQTAPNIFLCDCTVISFNITLPPVSSCSPVMLQFKRVGVSNNTVTLLGIIDSDSSYVLEFQDEFVVLTPVNNKYIVVAE